MITEIFFFPVIPLNVLKKTAVGQFMPNLMYNQGIG
jgi:hypothetical protein